MNDQLQLTPTEILSPLLELDSWDREILKIMFEYPGIKCSKIAKILGQRERWVTERVKKPYFQYALQRLNESTDDLLVKAARKAAAKLLDFIDHPNPMIALGAVKIALTRHLSQTLEPSQEAITGYRTTIEADGSLLQDVIRKELEDEARGDK